MNIGRIATLRFSFTTLLCSTLLTGAASPVAAQTVRAPPVDGQTLRAGLAEQMASPSRAMPQDVAELDAMVARKDWDNLTQRLLARRAPEDVALDLNWEQARLYKGAGFLMAYLYMTDLWRVGSSLPEADGGEIKQTAGAMFLYALDLIKLDGVKCADVSAPGHRQNQLFAQNQPVVAYMRALPADRRMILGTISLMIEGATASVRTNDDTLCSGGLAEISAGLKAQGSKPLKQVPNATGTVGKTYDVPRAPGYAPGFVGTDIWAARQGPIRQALPGYLTRFLATLGESEGAVPAK